MRNILGRGCLIPFANAPENSTVPNECLHSHLLAEIKNFLVVFLLSRCGWFPEIVDGGKGHIKNVADQNPEVVRRLQALMEKMDADLGISGTGPGVRPCGRVKNPKPLMKDAKEYT